MVENQQSRYTALMEVLRVISAKSARVFTYTTAVLGVAALVPGLQLPPELSAIAAGIGVEAIGILLERVAEGKASEDEIRQEVERAISASGIKDLLTRDDFYDAFAHLWNEQRSLSKQNQAILEALRHLDQIEPIHACF